MTCSHALRLRPLGKLAKYENSDRRGVRGWGIRARCLAPQIPPRCTANAGKAWSTPRRDPFLRILHDKIPNVSDFFQKHYPRSRFYLTNLRARDLDPKQVREWPDDLWFFPYYLNRRQVPYDARRGAPASDAYQRSR